MRREATIRIDAKGKEKEDDVDVHSAFASVTRALCSMT